MRLPSLFIPHGAGPCFFMQGHPGFPDIWEPLGDWLRGLATQIGQRPRAILVVSAHWQSPVFSVTASAKPSLLYDYYGFPAHTYLLKYPVSGSPELAGRVCELLRAGGFEAQQDPQRGLDHGAFIPLMLSYPQADIPVLQLSLQRQLNPAQHLAAGRCLAALRDEGVLIVASGMSFHNMRPDQNQLAERARAFDEWLNEAMTAAPTERWERLCNWQQAPHARFAHPTEEHLIPLMVACGTASEEPAQRIYSERLAGLVDVSAFRLG